METFTLLEILYVCQKDSGLAELERWAWFNFYIQKMQEKNDITQPLSQPLATSNQADPPCVCRQPWRRLFSKGIVSEDSYKRCHITKMPK